MLIAQMYLIECVSIAGDFGFVVIQWSATAAGDGCYSVVRGNNALDGV